MSEYLGWCPDVAKRIKVEVDCCDSCHEEDHQELAFLGQIEFDEGYYDVCCKMKELVLRHRPVP